MNLIATANARMTDFLRWGADAQGSTRPLGLMRIAIAIVVFVRFANEVSLYQGNSLSFVLLGVAFFGLTSAMLVGFKAQASCAGVALTLMTMHFYMGKMHGYPGWSSHHIYILIVSVVLLALSPWYVFLAMSFMALEVIPKLKLTDRGLVDVEEFRIVELFV